ncbi:unnamed protein product [Meloidogyne enterolobii]|uniref:Uncharacterized protein n=1 Tax=Meloidogyne enterolobii TaxID=390850 RepID=A0ACB0ZXN5_MELEN
MLFKRIIYLSKSPLKLNKFKNASTAAVQEEAIQQSKQIIKLDKENSFPTHFAPSRGIGRPIYSLIPGPKGELLADYVLFEETMKRQRVPWLCYNKMTSEERTIYIKHFKAIEERKLWLVFLIIPSWNFWLGKRGTTAWGKTLTDQITI